MLLRDGQDGIEAFLMRRVTQMKFAPGMYVFPGGRLDSRDRASDIPVRGVPDVRGTRGDSTLDRGLLVCAVRETFEETGVLLASGGRAHEAATEEQRLNIESGAPLGVLLQDHDSYLDADDVRLWSHWVTPEFETRRFDVRFYIAALPDGQQPADISGESDHAHWVRPSEALARHYAGELPMLPPTATTLREVGSHATVSAVMAAAGDRAIQPLLPHQNEQTGIWQMLHAYDRTVIHYETEARILSEVDGVKRLIEAES